MSTTDRTRIIDHEPMRDGNGSTRTWARTIAGQRYSFTAVLMPDGERRYFAKKLRAGKDWRFGSSWQPVLGWTFKPAVTVLNHVRIEIFKQDGTRRTSATGDLKSLVLWRGRWLRDGTCYSVTTYLDLSGKTPVTHGRDNA